LQGLVQSLEQALLSSELLAAPGLLELAVQYELHDLVAKIASCRPMIASRLQTSSL